MTAAVQARLDLVALEDGVACFGTRPPTHAVGLLDVVGAEAALASADDATQEEILAGRAQFLNAQTTPFQVLVRAEPVELARRAAKPTRAFGLAKRRPGVGNRAIQFG